MAGLNVTATTVTINDDDERGVQVSPTTLTAAAGLNVTATTVTITDDDERGVQVSPTTLTKAATARTRWF